MNDELINEVLTREFKDLFPPSDLSSVFKFPFNPYLVTISLLYINYND